MDKTKRPPEAVEFMLTVPVTKSGLGDVITALYDVGFPPSNIDRVNGAEVASKMLSKGGRPPGRATIPTKARAPDIRDALLVCMLANHPQPIKRKDVLNAALERLGEPVAMPRIATASNDLMKDGFIKSDGGGMWNLTKKGVERAQRLNDIPGVIEDEAPQIEEQAPPAEEEPPAGIKAGSLTERCYRLFAGDPLRIWTKMEMGKALEKDVRQPIDGLVEQGLVKKVKTGHYQLAGR